MTEQQARAKKIQTACDELALVAFERSEDLRAASYKFMLVIQEQMLVAAKRAERERHEREIGASA